MKRAQDLDVYYRLNGAIYIFDKEWFLDNQGINYTVDSFAYEMSNESSIDIDSELDFKIASIIAEDLQRAHNNCKKI